MSGAIRQITVVGLGLIGGSLCRAIRTAHPDCRIVASDRNAADLEFAKSSGIIDGYSDDIGSAVAGADIVVVATDLRAMSAVFAILDDAVAHDCVITDVGSVKADVIDLARRHMPQRFHRFVPGHPIAGTEASGVRHSLDDLFVSKLVLLCPTDDTDRDALSTVRSVWESLEAEVREVSAELHDELLAVTSHLPHLLAYCMVYGLANADYEHGDADTALGFAAGGFSDLTRIAQSRSDLWVDILLRNKAAVLAHAATFSATLAQVTTALERGDADALHETFEAARRVRSGFSDRRKL